MHPASAGENCVDLQHVRGNEHVKRAMEVAASGGHHLFLVGALGTGKTMLARALPLLLPEPCPEYGPGHSGSGTLKASRPILAPSPDSSPATVLGGRAGRLRPGVVTQADGGVLLLDELAALAQLRAALEQPTRRTIGRYT